MKKCKNCGKEFKPVRRQVHCTLSCAQKYGGRAHYHRNPEKRKKVTRDWREKNKNTKNKVYFAGVDTKCIKTYNREYHKKRRKTDPLFNLSHCLRGRINYAFKVEGHTKSIKTEQLLGANFEIVKNHLENLFTEGMSWDNHGEWEIDHIVPLASAKTEEKLKSLCHFKNLQPLWKEDNRVKSAKTNIY